MTKFTKERLEEIAELARKATYQPCAMHMTNLLVVCDSEVIEEMTRQFLASMEQEPVLYAAAETLAYAKMGELHLKSLSRPMGDAVIPLYAAPPAPVVPDGYVLVPKKLTAENGAKGVLSGEFSETKFINCPECFGDDDCETCDGSGRIEITVPVTWTTIKAIWAKGVEHLAAAPQQEVKNV